MSPRILVAMSCLLAVSCHRTDKPAPLGGGKAVEQVFVRPLPKDGPLGMKFVHLPKGTFYMGGGTDGKGKKIAGNRWKTEIKEDSLRTVSTLRLKQRLGTAWIVADLLR